MSTFISMYTWNTDEKGTLRTRSGTLLRFMEDHEYLTIRVNTQDGHSPKILSTKNVVYKINSDGTLSEADENTLLKLYGHPLA